MSLKGTAVCVHGEHLQCFFLQQAKFRLGFCRSLILLRCSRVETFIGGQAEFMSSNQVLQTGCNGAVIPQIDDQRSQFSS